VIGVEDSREQPGEAETRSAYRITTPSATSQKTLHGQQAEAKAHKKQVQLTDIVVSKEN